MSRGGAGGSTGRDDGLRLLVRDASGRNLLANEYDVCRGEGTDELSPSLSSASGCSSSAGEGRLYDGGALIRDRYALRAEEGGGLLSRSLPVGLLGGDFEGKVDVAVNATDGDAGGSGRAFDADAGPDPDPDPAPLNGAD